MTELLSNYLPIVIFIALSALIGGALLVAPFLVAVKRPDPEKVSAFEAGFDAFGHERGARGAKFRNVGARDGGFQFVRLEECDGIRRFRDENAVEEIAGFGFDLIVGIERVDGHVGVDDVVEDVFDGTMGDGGEVGADGFPEISGAVALGAELLEDGAAGGGVAAGGEFGEPFIEDRFAITVFFVTDEFGGAGLDVGSAVAEKGAALFEVEIEFAEFEVSFFDGGDKGVME